MDNKKEYLIRIKLYEEGFTKPYDGENREECPICSDNDAFTYKSWVKLGCDHYFHRHCIDIWIDNKTVNNINKSRCPLCQTNIEESYNRKERMRAINSKWILLFIILNVFFIFYQKKKLLIMKMMKNMIKKIFLM